MRVIILLFIITSCLEQTNGQGLIFNKESFESGQHYESERSDFIPESFSIKKFAPYVFQQQLSTCVAYSSATALTMMNAILKRETDVKNISLEIVSPHWIYFRNKDVTDDQCKEGLDIEKAMKDILNYGVPYMLFVEYPEYYPFGDVQLCNYYPPDFEKDAEIALVNRPDEILRISYSEDIKAVISKGLPVIIGMNVPVSFENCFGKELWTPTAVETILDGYGHAMVVVGYDDKKYGGAYEILNSWGESWGNEGYIWIKYSDFKKFFLGGYALYKERKLGSDTPSLLSKEDTKNIEMDFKLSKNKSKKSNSNKNRWENMTK